jgi:hypothetical protein
VSKTKTMWKFIALFAYRRWARRDPDTLKPTGVPGNRDPEQPCTAYSPRPYELGDWNDCESDGHYLCRECAHLTRESEYHEFREVTPPSPEPPTDTAIRLLRRYFANESESRGGYDELTSETADFLERLDGVSQGQAEPPSQPTDCPKHGGINQYCSVCLAELAEKVAIGARVSPTAAIDALELAKQVLDGLDSYCGANDAGEPYEGEDCPHEYIGLDLMQKTRNALTAALKQGGTQS